VCEFDGQHEKRGRKGGGGEEESLERGLRGNNIFFWRV